jgi:hypothetical protein
MRRSVISIIILVSITLACLLPFIHKAFHIDDPLFIWAARQISHDPYNFYGFDVNWSDVPLPMPDVTKNPPLASYYIALAASMMGWSEIALHAAFLVPAILAVIGTYFLAGELCSMPLIAALAGVLTPVFLLSSTSVMCDTMMLSFWVWAVFLWIWGIKNNSNLSLTGSAVLIAFASLTKYYGICLIPLLLAYSLARERRFRYTLLFLLIPVAAQILYNLLTHSLYGRSLLLDAFKFASGYHPTVSKTVFTRTLTGLSFTGGCLLTALLYSPLLWRKRILAACAVISLVIILLSYGQMGKGTFFVDSGGFNWPFAVQCFLFSVGGVSVILLASSDLWKRRSADSLLLFLWITGTFIFAVFLNWTVNGRSILPMAPAVGILVVRRLESFETADTPGNYKRILLPLIISLIISLLVVWSDYRLADTARRAADVISAQYADNPGSLWFQGHWGFQYYMEEKGGKPFNALHLTMSPGDIVVAPHNNYFNFLVPRELLGFVETTRFASFRWLSTMSDSVRAGFYSEEKWGPLPFAFGHVSDEEYYEFIVVR